MDKTVIKAMEPFFSRQFYNPSAIYLSGRAVRGALEAARTSIAQNLGSRPSEIIFTAGATEANNLAVQGIMRAFPDGEVLVSAIEHESVLAPASLFKHREIPVNSQGIIDTSVLKKMISRRTVLVTIGLVNNEIGSVQSLREIAEVLKQAKKLRGSKGLPLYLHTDAAQAPNYFNLNVARLGVDLLSLNGGKIYGPKQSGALYIRSSVELRPLILGGGQENGLRSGTENVAAAVGLASALDLSQEKRLLEVKRVTNLRQLFVETLQQTLPQAIVNGSSKHSAPHILSVTFPGVDNERLMMELDERGIQTATGSACSASSDEPSHVLAAMGLGNDAINSSLRFSFGRGTKKSDIKSANRTLFQLLKN
jgi:cysteine desulfurase